VWWASFLLLRGWVVLLGFLVGGWFVGFFVFFLGLCGCWVFLFFFSLFFGLLWWSSSESAAIASSFTTSWLLSPHIKRVKKPYDLIENVERDPSRFGFFFFGVVFFWCVFFFVFFWFVWWWLGVFFLVWFSIFVFGFGCGWWLVRNN